MGLGGLERGSWCSHLGDLVALVLGGLFGFLWVRFGDAKKLLRPFESLSRSPLHGRTGRRGDADGTADRTTVAGELRVCSGRWALLEELLSGVVMLFDIFNALKGYAGGSVVSVRSTDRSFAYRDL